MLLSRIGDGLDGAVAKIAGKTDLGGYLDIVLDFLFYGVIPIGFVLADPAGQRRRRRGPAVFLLRQRRQLPRLCGNGREAQAWRAHARGPKSLFFTTGLAEATETIAVFAAFCLVPQWFPELAYAFAALTFYTALSRIVLAARTFGKGANSE